MPRITIRATQKAYESLNMDKRKGYTQAIREAVAVAKRIEINSVEASWEVLLWDSNTDPICIDVYFSISLLHAFIPFRLRNTRMEIVRRIRDRLRYLNLTDGYSIWTIPLIGAEYQLIHK